MKIDQDFLSKLYLGGCPHGAGWCTAPGARFTDFNLWGRYGIHQLRQGYMYVLNSLFSFPRALERKELEDWTSCK